MARPQKQTVDYFPHYTGASGGKTLFILQNKFGNDGYAFWFKLLEVLGATEGHFFDYGKSAEWQFLLAKTGVSDGNKVLDILQTLANVEAIDPDLYQQKVIWSQHFVDNLTEVYRNRKRPLPERPIKYKLLTGPRICCVCGSSLENMRPDAKYCSDKCRLQRFRETDNETDNSQSTVETPISTPDNPVSTPNNLISTLETTQSKVEYSKEKKSREENSKENVPVSCQPLTLEQIYEIYQQNTGLYDPLTDNIKRKIEEAFNKYPAAWLVDAICEACVHNRNTWAYCAGVLENFAKEGHKEKVI
jgi:hypothetical protein